jgi:hypothetical protein
MRWHLGGSWAAAAVLSFAGLAVAGGPDRVKRPRLDLRASPRVAFSPVEVFAVGELRGGGDVEDFYCPGLEWDWGDGSRSARESDCAPFAEGAEVDRFYSARHAFRGPGVYTVRLTLRRGGRTVAVASVAVSVHGQSASLFEP